MNTDNRITGPGYYPKRPNSQLVIQIPNGKRVYVLRIMPHDKSHAQSASLYYRGPGRYTYTRPLNSSPVVVRAWQAATQEGWNSDEKFELEFAPGGCLLTPGKSTISIIVKSDSPPYTKLPVPPDLVTHWKYEVL